MIEAGGYDLRVTCDSVHYYSNTKLIRTYRDECLYNPQTLQQAKKELEKRSWIFKRNGKTYCSRKCENGHI